jgi:hypothetical protein
MLDLDAIDDRRMEAVGHLLEGLPRGAHFELVRDIVIDDFFTLIAEDRELREENARLKAEVEKLNTYHLSSMVGQEGPFKDAMDNLHAEAAVMRALCDNYLKDARDEREALDEDALCAASYDEVIAKIEAALSGDAGKQLAERFEELVEWARRACEQQKQMRVAFGIGVGESELPEWLDA